MHENTTCAGESTKSRAFRFSTGLKLCHFFFVAVAQIKYKVHQVPLRQRFYHTGFVRACSMPQNTRTSNIAKSTNHLCRYRWQDRREEAEGKEKLKHSITARLWAQHCPLLVSEVIILFFLQYSNGGSHDTHSAERLHDE